MSAAYRHIPQRNILHADPYETSWHRAVSLIPCILWLTTHRDAISPHRANCEQLRGSKLGAPPTKVAGSHIGVSSGCLVRPLSEMMRRYDTASGSPDLLSGTACISLATLLLYLSKPCSGIFCPAFLSDLAGTSVLTGFPSPPSSRHRIGTNS